ncbi:MULTISPECIES: hypothetical protein [unclassified Phenylobacterium]|jgi:hypothetical protein|uniref:hypothetical protein n=1 Tax=unclassified Phenylobacterium TaxID=2640670 RepID=UPI0009E8407F|nr:MULTISPECIES: hypothetical protein [unclassified Phenylobacterium]
MAMTRYTSRPGLNATRARQGRFGVHMFWVLAVSTALAALALFGAWSWRAAEQPAPPSKAHTARTAQSFDLGAPAPGTLQTTPTPDSATPAPR